MGESRDLGSTRYFAVIHNGFTREWPSGLRRRTVVDAAGDTADEAWTARGQWEATTFFRGEKFGDFTNSDVPYVEVDEAEAESIRSMIGVRPRGGPFTDDGQRWLAANPDDPAAKYLGVRGPVYDSAGRLIEPMGPVPGERAR